MAFAPTEMKSKQDAKLLPNAECLQATEQYAILTSHPGVSSNEDTA